MERLLEKVLCNDEKDRGAIDDIARLSWKEPNTRQKSNTPEKKHTPSVHPKTFGFLFTIRSTNEILVLCFSHNY